ncbi:helix-turn-helix transcriptional regulator [Stappia sp.]|uniref:helix-turn-helix transcriptional regulator n=1 Tax=Stappia sp. TaxID=1870903 RepID=UPI003A9A25B8
MKVFRLFALLDHLRSAASPVSAEALARALDVSPRTIYRDMATLQAMGAPVRGEAGLGYQLERGYFLPPLRFDADELEAVMLGLRLVRARGDGVLRAAAERASGKIGATAAGDAGNLFQHLPLRAVSRRKEGEEIANRWLPLLRAAIRERRLVGLDYVDLEGRGSARQVRPLGLTLFDEVWLLTAWCENRAGFRNFRLDRIADAAVTGARFRHESGRRFQDYLASLREPVPVGAGVSGDQSRLKGLNSGVSQI